MKFENSHKKSLSTLYTEEHTSGLAQDIRTHLALLLSDGYKYIPSQAEELTINEFGIHYSDLAAQQLSTPQSAIVLLEVADFFFKNGGADNANVSEASIVILPGSYTKSLSSKLHAADLLGDYPIRRRIFCLSQAFHILRGKLIERQTGLYHLLFLKTILMLEREKVPSEFILGAEYASVNWLDLVQRYIIPNDNKGKGITLDIQGTHSYPLLLGEIEALYGEIFVTEDLLAKLVRKG